MSAFKKQIHELHAERLASKIQLAVDKMLDNHPDINPDIESYYQKKTMTVRNKLENALIAKGMSNPQAVEVLDLSIPEINTKELGYKITFDSPEDAYPEVIYNVLSATITPIALRWIDENKPLAWFRPMFLPENN